MMIPKKIHYCWFGGKPLPAYAEKCIASWRTICPDYEIIFWNEENASFKECQYAIEAYQAGKWAFVSDYVRLKVLWEHGGIYLDTDVEALNSFDRFLDTAMFMGFESKVNVATCVIGATAQHPFLAKMLKEYQSDLFLREDGSYDYTTNVDRITKRLKTDGLRLDGTFQVVDDISFYPCDVFSPKSLETGKVKLSEETCTIHHFDASWMSQRQRLHTKIAQIIGPRWAKRVAALRRALVKGRKKCDDKRTRADS